MSDVVFLLIMLAVFVAGWFGIWFLYYYITDYRLYRKIYNMEEWIDNIANNCRYKDEGDTMSIPVSLPKCKLTKDFCDYNTCPLVKRKTLIKRKR